MVDHELKGGDCGREGHVLRGLRGDQSWLVMVTFSGVDMNNRVGDWVKGNRICVWGLEIELE